VGSLLIMVNSPWIELSEMLTRSYLEASNGFIMLLTLPFGPTYRIPENTQTIKYSLLLKFMHGLELKSVQQYDEQDC